MAPITGGGSYLPFSPANGYVTEDFTPTEQTPTFYVAEDGVTFYVQES